MSFFGRKKSKEELREEEKKAERDCWGAGIGFGSIRSELDDEEERKRLADEDSENWGVGIGKKD